MTGVEDNGLLQVLNKAERFLREKGIEAPRLDAQLLLAHVLDCDRVRLYVDYAKPLSPKELDDYRQLIRRRAQAEPLAYILGRREFWSMDFSVDSRVLIPRPDTETLLEEVVDRLAGQEIEMFVDVGTGSGCLACSLAKLFSESLGVAIDLDLGALDVARRNIQHLGCDQRVVLNQGHLLEPLAGRRADLICANLPYIPSGQLSSLAADIRWFEPSLALDGGADGLVLIRELIQKAPAHLQANGWLFLEVGDGQAAQVEALCRQVGLVDVNSRADLSGIERVVSARMPV